MIELIIIGKEILSGQIREANHQYLAQKLLSYGHKINSTTIIDDNIDTIVKQLNQSSQRSQFVIISGGLGPTKDDLTKLALAKFLNSELIESSSGLTIVEKNFKRAGAVYEKEKYTYHLKTKEMTFHENLTGRAPLITFTNKKTLFFSFPGVIKEFQSATDTLLLPNLTKNEELVITKALLHGVNEAELFSTIAPNLFEQLEKLGSVSSLPRPWGLEVTILSDRSHSQNVNKMFTNIVKDHFIGINFASLADAVIKKAIEKKIKIGTVESCTGGLVASSLTDIPGSSAVFEGSVVTYSNSVKMNIVNVKKETLSKYGAVSTQTASEMAQGAALALNVDLAVSTTGIAGPGGGSEEKPVGTVCIAVASKNKILISKRFELKGDRETLKNRFAAKALYLIFKCL